MKASNLIYGVICTILAGISLYISVSFDNDMSGIFSGMTGAFGMMGITAIIRYFYWRKNPEKYQEKIDLQDPNKMKELSKYGEALENNSKKIEIDLSYDEYVADKDSYDL